jgi:hypothetical protein
MNNINNDYVPLLSNLFYSVCFTLGFYLFVVYNVAYWMKAILHLLKIQNSVRRSTSISSDSLLGLNNLRCCHVE